MTVSERVHMFGHRESLVGVVTLPPAGLPTGEDRPFIIVLNSGLVHRVGPFRQGVILARKLASRGFRVLRFDLSGFGDSPPTKSNSPRQEQVVSDGRAAMEFLIAHYGATRFIVGGLCAGAIYAHRICLADERVVGMWMLDGYAYPTRRYWLHMLSRKIRQARSVRALCGSLLRRAQLKLRSLRGTVDAKGASDDGQVIFNEVWPDISVARSEVERILRRGSRMLFVYTGGWSTFVHPRQFNEMFPNVAGHEGVTVKYYPEADHTYLSVAHREQMFHDLANFVDTIR
jgi:pimeloyl-ACP methyl ester carboxylesterase